MPLDIRQTGPDGPFHEGECAMQTRAGVRERLASVGPRLIRDFMPDQHRAFFAQLPFIITGSLDPRVRPVASLIAGPPGFITSPDPRRLDLATRPPAANLAPGAPIGLLGIEPSTRRRNRVSGVIAEANADGFSVHVRQSFGNCPQYIQARRAEYSGSVTPAHASHVLDRLDAESRGQIERADTFFIATAHRLATTAAATAAHGVDVSHRGGKPGFVRVDEDVTLTVPDFSGNLFFNTLGNLAVNPLAGLLFVDFDYGSALHVTATAEVIWDGDEVASFAGAQRLLRLRVLEACRTDGAVPLRWGAAQLSPQLVATGAWDGFA